MARSFFFARQRLLFREPSVGNVDVRPNEGDRFALGVAFDLGDGPDPAHRAVVWAHHAIFRHVGARIAGENVEKMLDRARPVVRMDALHPFVVGLDRGIGRQPVQPQILGRPVAGETAAHVDPHAADAADLLHAREFELPMPQPLEDRLALGRIPEGDADPVAKRKGPHLVITIGLARRVGLKDLLFAVDHHLAVAAFEFGPDSRRRNLPDRLAENVVAPKVEHLFGRPIEGGEAPAGIEREEAFREAVEDLIDQRSAVRLRSRVPSRSFPPKALRPCSAKHSVHRRSWSDAS